MPKVFIPPPGDPPIYILPTLEPILIKHTPEQIIKLLGSLENTRVEAEIHFAGQCRVEDLCHIEEPFQVPQRTFK